MGKRYKKHGWVKGSFKQPKSRQRGVVGRGFKRVGVALSHRDSRFQGTPSPGFGVYDDITPEVLRRVYGIRPPRRHRERRFINDHFRLDT